MKKIMSLVLAVTLLMSVFGGLTVFAADASGIPDDYEKVDAVVETVTKEWLENQGYETVDPVSKVNELYGWKVYDADKDGIAETLEIFYTGMPKGYTSKDYITRPWQDQVKTITALVIKGTPTRVPQYGFQEMSALKSVKLAGTEQAVEKGAFANCKALTGVISIPKTATEIKAQAFQNTKVTGLIFEGDAETAPIAVDSFAYMGKLSNITLMRSLTTAKKTVKDFGGAYAGGSWGMASPAKINVLTTDASFISDLAELTAYTDYQLASTNTTNITNKEHNLNPGTFGKYTLIDSSVTTVKHGKYTEGVSYIEYTDIDGKKVVEFVTNGDETGDKMADVTTFTDNKKGSYEKMVLGVGFKKIPEKFGIAYKSLKELKLPTTMVKIDDFAFDKVGTMVKANFEDTKITYIGMAAFRNSKFKELRFPTTLIQVNQKAFINNNALECVYFPKATTLVLGQWAFASEEKDTSSYAGKNLKVIFGDVTFSVSTKVDTFAPDDATSTNWRTTTIIYDSSKTTLTKNFNQAIEVPNEYYEVSDADGDGKINLFMCDFSKNQSYKLFMCTYEGTALDKLHAIKEDTLAKGEFINMEFDTSEDVKKDKTKVFLWEGFSSCKPLVPALLK